MLKGSMFASISLATNYILVILHPAILNNRAGNQARPLLKMLLIPPYLNQLAPSYAVTGGRMNIG